MNQPADPHAAMLPPQGGLSIFWSGPLVGTLMGLAMVLLLWPLARLAREKLRPPAA